MKRLISAAALLVFSGNAGANLSLEFREGAPKDRFVLNNIGDCTLADATVTIDFKNSAGELIFDVTGSGAGVEVFQPIRVESGAKYLTQKPIVKDGQTEVTFNLSALDVGKKLVVSTDVDDTIGAREITVETSEFSGTEVRVTVGGKTFSAVFADTPQTVVNLDGC